MAAPSPRGAGTAPVPADRMPGIRSVFRVRGFQRRLLDDPCAALVDLRERYGDVVGIGSRTGPTQVYLFGREADAFILSRHKELFRHHEAYESTMPAIGTTALVVSEGDDHERRRRIVQPALRAPVIEGVVPVVCGEVDDVIDSLPVDFVVDLQEQFKFAVGRSLTIALLGEQLADRADEIIDLLGPALEFNNLPPHKQRKIKVVGSAFYNAIKGRALVNQIIDAEAERRRALPAGQRPTGDILGRLLAGEDGDRFSDKELHDQVVGLLVAGLDSTSALLDWVLHRLLSDRDVWERVATEITAKIGNGSLTIEGLATLSYVDWVVKETLRLHPPVVVAARVAVKDFEFQGHQIKGGSLVRYSPYVTGRDPELWLQPDTFVPQRWDEAAIGFVPPLAYGYIPFGGGPRRCPGSSLATLIVKASVVQIVRRLTAVAQYAGSRRTEGYAVVTPAGGLPALVVAVRPRSEFST